MTALRDVDSAHLDAATIAALVDRTLDPAARAAAEAHLAGCADCREIWMETSDIASETEVGGWAATPAAADALVLRGRSHRWIYGGAGLAIAAALALAVFSPRMFDRGDRPELRELVEAVGTNRRTEARLTGGFHWGPVPSVTRGEEPQPPPTTVLLATARLRESSLRAGAAPRAAAAAGSAALVEGDASAAAVQLEDAVRQDPENAHYWSDLSAARIEIARTRADADTALDALRAADRAISLAPGLTEALYNRALALELLDRRADTRAALEGYLRIDDTSPWADEVRQRLNRLR